MRCESKRGRGGGDGTPTFLRSRGNSTGFRGFSEVRSPTLVGSEIQSNPPASRVQRCKMGFCLDLRREERGGGRDKGVRKERKREGAGVPRS
eukprot:1202228-Amorphochlora_amoeboformis.AAC.1